MSIASSILFEEQWLHIHVPAYMRNSILGIQNYHNLYIMSSRYIYLYQACQWKDLPFLYMEVNQTGSKIKSRTHRRRLFIYPGILFFFYTVCLSSIWMTLYHTEIQILVRKFCFFFNVKMTLTKSLNKKKRDLEDNHSGYIC